jgi:uncharacterized protein YhjY with autotransporter beta-barrel domain
MSLASGALLGFAVAPQAHAITTQDNIDPESLVDTSNTFSDVVGIAILTQTGPNSAGGFVCSGTLVNPRTVFTASHCVANDFGGSELYSENGFFSIGVTTDPQFGLTNVINWLNTGVGMNNVTDVIMPPGQDQPGVFSFPDQDFTMLALGTPVDTNGTPILLSPITREFVATMVGYGTFGTGSDPEQGLDFRRRSARNVVQYLGTFANFDDDTFGPGSGAGDSTQQLYWVDFDRVGRQEFFDDALGIDYDPLPGDALTSNNPTRTEGNTGGGDSGGPLLTRINGRQFIVGTLSGGLTIFSDDNGPLFDFYGTETYWNPIYKYAAEIIANNPYKYVHALRGDGDWTDPHHWEQTLDPNFYILDRHGNPVNAIPTSDPSDASTQFGTFRNIFDVLDGGDGLPDDASVATNAGQVVFTDDVAAIDVSNTARGGFPGSHNGNGSGNGSNGNHGTPRPPTLQGPGSRNFVPNNTDGTPGVAYQNPAQYFDVTFDNRGTTTLRNAAIEIDHLTLANDRAELDIRRTGSLLVNLETEIESGQLNVDGALATRNLINSWGVLSGKGTITAPGGVYNLGGIVSPGDYDIGTLTVNGSFSQSHFGTMFYQIANNGTHDLLSVTGSAAIAGDLIVQTDRKLRFGDRYEVIHANGGVSGNFDDVFSGHSLLYGRTVADADSIDLLIDAHRISEYLGHGSPMWSLGQAIDMARLGGHYHDLAGLFDVIDYIDVNNLNFVLPTFAPMSAFSQLGLASDFSQGMTQSLTVRMSELRAGVRGMSPTSMLAGQRMLQSVGANVFGPDPSMQLQSGPAAPQQSESRFGAFVSGFGNLSDVGGEAYDGDHFNLATLTTASSANITAGVDYRVDDHFVIGVATTISRYMSHDDGVTPFNYAGYGATAYTGWWSGNWNVDSYVGIAHQDYEMNRVLTPGLSGTSADSKPGASQMMAGIRAGWSMHPFNGFEIGPRVSLDYQRLTLDGYAEAGGGDLNLRVDGREITSVQVQTALAFAYQPVDRNGIAGPFAAFGSVAMVNALGDGSDVVQARFAAAPEFPFVIANGLDRSWETAALGMAYRPNADTSFGLQASSDFGRDDALSSSSLQVTFNRSF